MEGIDYYPLPRNYRSVARLNLQHYIWQRIQGFLIHPTIDLSSNSNIDNIKVADIGTGTGAWLLDVAPLLPDSAQLDGFDIDLSQCPASEWLPSNVTMRKLDVYGEVPEDLVGKYDLIHIRFFIIVIKKANPEPVLKSLMKMLKPGGWIQWTEQDPYTQKIVTASPSISASVKHTDALLAFMHSIFHQVSGESPGWVANLSHTFEKLGLQQVVEARRKAEKSDMPNFYDIFLLGMEEISLHMLNGQDIREMIQHAALEMEENRRGVAITVDSVTVVGRKVTESH